MFSTTDDGPVVIPTLHVRDGDRLRDPSGTRLDPVGAVVSVLGLFALLLGTIEGPERGWTSPLVLGAYVAAAVLLTLFVWWKLRVAHPMLDPRYFSVASFRNGSATITVMFFATFGMFFLVAQFLQYVKGYTPLAAGVALMPAGISFIVLAPRGPAIAARIGSYPSIAIGMLAAACGFALLSIVGQSTPYVWLGVALVLMTGGGALAMPASTAAIVSSLPPAKAGVGSAVNDVTREVGGALGIAVLGSIVSALYRSDISATADGLPAGLGARVEESIGSAMAAASESDGAAAAAEQAREAFASATSVGFMVAAVLMLIGSAAYFRLHQACVRRSLQAPAAPTTEQAALAGVPACR